MGGLAPNRGLHGQACTSSRLLGVLPVCEAGLLEEILEWRIDGWRRNIELEHFLEFCFLSPYCHRDFVFYLLPKFLFASTVYYAMPPHIDEDNKATIKACASYAKCTKEEKEEEATEKKLEIAGKFQSMMEMGNVKSAK